MRKLTKLVWNRGVCLISLSTAKGGEEAVPLQKMNGRLRLHGYGVQWEQRFGTKCIEPQRLPRELKREFDRDVLRKGSELNVER